MLWDIVPRRAHIPGVWNAYGYSCKAKAREVAVQLPRAVGERRVQDEVIPIATQEVKGEPTISYVPQYLVTKRMQVAREVLGGPS